MAVVRGGTVYTMGDAGVVRADVRIVDGRIERVTDRIEPERGEEVIEAAGLVVTPGFVDPHSHVGGFDGEAQDLNELTCPRTPELDALHGIDPASDDFEYALAQGITTSLVIPGSGNVIGGWGVVIKSAGPAEGRVLRHPAVLKAATGINPKGVYSGRQQMPMTRMGIIYLLRSYLRDVRDYRERKRAHEEDPSRPAPDYDAGLEHGIPVLDGEMPLKVHTYMQDMTLMSSSRASSTSASRSTMPRGPPTSTTSSSTRTWRASSSAPSTWGSSRGRAASSTTSA